MVRGTLDNEPGAQTGRPGAVAPVRGLLGGTTSPAALFHSVLVPRYVRGPDVRYFFPATSFQKSAAGFLLISVSPGIERKIFSCSGR